VQLSECTADFAGAGILATRWAISTGPELAASGWKTRSASERKLQYSTVHAVKFGAPPPAPTVRTSPLLARKKVSGPRIQKLVRKRRVFGLKTKQTSKVQLLGF